MASSMANWRNPVPYTQLSERQQKIVQSLWDCTIFLPAFHAGDRRCGWA
jgi:hypothetical protein